jgi:hypothetical protein
VGEGCGQNKITQSDTAAAITDKKNILGATVSRYIRKGTRMIKLTGDKSRPARLALPLSDYVPLLDQSLEHFFPDDAFSDERVKRDSPAYGYSLHLSFMEEPSLFKLAEIKDCEAYRFLWLRSFHAPFSFRLHVRQDGTGFLFVKSTNRGGFEQLVLSKATNLDQDQVQHFTTALEDLQFWILQTSEQSHPGLDGAQWIFEGVKAGNYHVMNRWSPKDGQFRQLMQDLVALSGITVEPVY